MEGMTYAFHSFLKKIMVCRSNASVNVSDGLTFS